MSLHLYNTLTRKKEVFQSIKKGKVGLYACGPTVYWFAHIGNFRAFLFADLLRRVLMANGLEVKFVMNLTDVGHLTDDADDGDDKMIVAMRREGKTAYEIADFYINAFMKDVKRLNILPADVYPKPTNHIDEQIDMIKRLEKNGFTYTTSNTVYFDTSKLKDYGKLSGQNVDDKKAGARVDIGEKKNAADFALWKLSPEGAQREMEWDSPWGKGFPGWHIECSAMSAKYLNVPFDIHTGGIDHIPVHHENEIAQTQGANGVLQANTWMHSEFLTVDGGKMSKSLGNLFTFDDLEKKGFDPLVYRYFVLGAHYRTKLNFTLEALDAARNALNKLRSIVRSWDKPAVGCAEFEEHFLCAINDDLNTPQALAVMWELIDSDYPTSAKAESLLKFDQVLGLGLDKYIAVPLEIPSEVEKLVKEREKARVAKDWERSDKVRAQIENLGYLVEDTDAGPQIKQK